MKLGKKKEKRNRGGEENKVKDQNVKKKMEWRSFPNIVRIDLKGELDASADKKRDAHLGLGQISFDEGNYPKAFSHWTSVREDDSSATATANLALMYEVGLAPGGRDVPKALRFYREAAAKKVPMAMHRLGYFLFLMSKEQPEKDRGFSLIKAAAGAFCPEALFDAGMIMLHGLGEVPCDPKSGLRHIEACFSRCVELDGAQFEVAFEAAFQIGTYLGLMERLDDALFYALYAAENEHALAQDLASQLYLKGAKESEDMTTDHLYSEHQTTNFQKAVFWLEKATKKGVVSSMRDLAVLIDAGSLPGSDEKVLQLYTDAAQKGDAISQYQLGFIFLEGDLAEKDEERGFELLRKSADQLFVPAIEHLLLDSPQLKLDPKEQLDYKLLLVRITKNGTERERKSAVRILKKLGAEVEACHFCFEIQKPLKNCSSCKKVSYCSAECQKAAWAKHKPDCA